MDRKIKTKKSQGLSSWNYNRAGYAAVMGMAERVTVAKCWNQPDTLRKTAHVRWNMEYYTFPKSAVPGKPVAPVTLLPSILQGLGSWWLLKRNIRDTGSGHSLTITQCVTKPVPGTMHVMLWQTVHTVTLVGGFSSNTWEPSQYHKPAWLRRTLGEDKSCLLFQNFSIQNHFLKAAKIHQIFQGSTPLTASKEISDHQMTPIMGFLRIPNLRSLSYSSVTHLSSNPCVVWVHNAQGNGTGSSTCRFCWWEYAPCRHMRFCLIHREGKEMSSPKQTHIHCSEIVKSSQ